MNNVFYAGHEFKWMNNFLEAVPENKWFRKSIAMCVACCIHHQFVYKKQSTFKLTHKTLSLFGVNRKCLRRYLFIFQQAGLIKYTIKNKRSPIITLLLLPYNYYTINKDTLIQYTVPMSQKGQTYVPKRTCRMSQKDDSQLRVLQQGNLPSKGRYLPTKQGNRESKVTKEVREGM